MLPLGSDNNHNCAGEAELIIHSCLVSIGGSLDWFGRSAAFLFILVLLLSFSLQVVIKTFLFNFLR